MGKQWIIAGSNTLRGLEESANKKLNKHSSSLDNTDWIAYYEKLRKDLSVNSPKNPGHVSVNSNRSNGVVIAEKFLKETGLTKAQARLKKSTNMGKEKYQVGLNTERYNIPEGRRTALSSTPKPILLLHQKK